VRKDDKKETHGNNKKTKGQGRKKQKGYRAGWGGCGLVCWGGGGFFGVYSLSVKKKENECSNLQPSREEKLHRG